MFRIGYGFVLLVALAATPPSMPAPPPDPGVGVREHHDAQDAVESKPAPQQEPSAAPPILHPATAPDDEKERTEAAPDNEDQPVRVSSVPRLDVNKDIADYAYVLFSLLLVIVGGLQVVLLRGTLVATKNAARAATMNAEVARDALRLDQRPWLVPTGGATLVYSTDPRTWKPEVLMRIDFKNTGRTPACKIDIVVSANTSQWSDPLRASVEYNEPVTVGRVGAVGPGIAHEHWTPISFDESSYYELLHKGRLRLDVCGVIKYRDQQAGPVGTEVPTSHETKFCIVWLGPGMPFAIEGPYNDCT